MALRKTTKAVRESSPKKTLRDPGHVILHVLVEELPHGTWRATCLEWDIVSEENTKGKALDQLFRLMDLQWKSAVEHGAPDSVWHPAPPELWKKFFRRLHLEKSGFAPPPKQTADIVYT